MGNVRWSNAVFAVAYVVLVLGLFLALGGTAYAQNAPTSAGDQYGSAASDQYGTRVTGVKITAESDTEASATGSSALPNTGLSLVGTAAIGLVLVGAGIGLRRRERRQR
jgi:LPXTG-motif cell wall-anchored protein